MISLRAARVLTGVGGVQDTGASWVTVDGPDIVSVGPDPAPDSVLRDLGDLQLWPGVVDLHADSLARFESPRPGARIPLDAAVADFAFDAAAHGITRPHLCVSVGEGPDASAHLEHTSAVLAAVESLSGHTVVPLTVHLRAEVSDPDCIEHTRAVLDRYQELIRLVSVMDHTPRRGQYPETESWRRAMRARTGASDEALDDWLSRLLAQGDEPAHRRRSVADLARCYGCVFASHDDDSSDAVSVARGSGATISEFPLTASAAAAAHSAGLHVVMGAPNAWRGGSHLSGLSARAALADGTLDVLTSDYDSGAVIRAVLALVEAGLAPVGTAVELVTGGPARAVGLDVGRLAAGCAADLVVVDPTAPRPVIATWSKGRCVVRG